MESARRSFPREEKGGERGLGVASRKEKQRIAEAGTFPSKTRYTLFPIRRKGGGRSRRFSTCLRSRIDEKSRSLLYALIGTSLFL